MGSSAPPVPLPRVAMATAAATPGAEWGGRRQVPPMPLPPAPTFLFLQNPDRQRTAKEEPPGELVAGGRL